MKRLFFLLMTLALLLPIAALAEEAQDITRECIVNKQAWNEKKPFQACDSNYATFYKGQAITIQAPEGKTIGALMIKWQVQPKSGVVLLRSDDGNKFTEVLREECKYAQQLIVLDTPESILRFKAASGQMEVNDIVVLTQGEIPASIPQWKDAPEKVDLMLFSTHPDDEVLWFGGLLPTYAGEQDKEVLVINAVFSTYRRKLELLDSLWTCGVENYPIFFGFKGGKGIATSFGSLLFVYPIQALLAFSVFLILVFITHYVSVGSIVAAFTLPALVILTTPFDPIIWGIMAFLGTMVIYRHKSNIVRLMQHKENKLDFSVFKKKK